MPCDVKNTVLEALKPLSARSFTNSGLTIEMDSNVAQELLDLHNQELRVDALIEMHEQDIEELETLYQVQREGRMLVGNWT
ncbi:hypothetical protein TNCV_3208611 [Trichonephila clavipes]|nr:hypothetical protein TNCV_3208611 [Trichonephila clavipes]